MCRSGLSEARIAHGPLRRRSGRRRRWLGVDTATVGQTDRNTGQLIAVRTAQPGGGTTIAVRSSTTTSDQKATPAQTLVLTTPHRHGSW